ncbi:hypothetical protein [Chryseosolibacter indicus]|uniref:DUF4377 domain-containing protein n=1 Tax=Chryseosolibacter indicus TaxID=2782351 RepID=A0ABS5VNW5_9BACT|nr:hypothetical protein [Chryseosolibacter indicus]MBT1703041.1 hypothetical protein [Chryseosolibacter indicus]
MKLLTLLSLLVAVSFSNCSENAEASCKTKATVRDLTGLDGCGYVFELEDGSRLVPVLSATHTEGKDKDALSGFEFKEGKVVLIDYKLTASVTTCMSGATVEITCISTLDAKTKN